LPFAASSATIRLRRCILEHLYARFQEYPLAAIELGQLLEACRTTARELNWNIVYLEKNGWVELDLGNDCPPYVACTAALTGAGIELVENVQTFEDRFALPE
jgi:hypothetical protein